MLSKETSSTIFEFLYYSTWDGTPISRAIGEHSTHLTNIYIYIYIYTKKQKQKQSDGEVPVMLEFGGMRSTSSLPSLPDPLWPEVVDRNRVLSIDQIEINCVLILNWIARNRIDLTSKLCAYAKLNYLK